MIIEHNITKYIVFYEDTILHALGKISENEARIIFAVKENGILEGVLSDGDFRRWLVEQKEINLNLFCITLFLKLIKSQSNDKYVLLLTYQLGQVLIVFISGLINNPPLINVSKSLGHNSPQPKGEIIYFELLSSFKYLKRESFEVSIYFSNNSDILIR